MRSVVAFAACMAVTAALTGCTTFQAGPNRPITIEEDVAWARSLAEPDVRTFYGADPVTQAAMRNQVVTARMYIADLEYHYYEARLTKDIQEQGLAATLANLGLTTSATLIAPAATKTILSGIATGVTGADKAFNEKVLLSNTIQALQTQMRADRKEQAGVIYAKMFKAPGVVTSIAEYTLPMALSDVDAYYQAGTISSALLGLTKTVANKEVSADQAKTAAGPNPKAVASVQVLASPTQAVIGRRPAIIRDGHTQLERYTPPLPPPGRTWVGPYEKTMSQKDMDRALAILGCPGKDLGPEGSDARKALTKFLTDNGKPAADRLTVQSFIDLREIGKKGTCSK